MKKLAVILVLSLALVLGVAGASCTAVSGNNQGTTPPAGNEEPLGQEFNLPVGQSAAIAGEDLLISFIEVTTDSRAPRGVEAFWAGEAKCRMQITYQGSTSEAILTESGATDGYTQDSFGPYTINFQLQPYPEAGYQPAADDYVLTLQITK